MHSGFVQRSIITFMFAVAVLVSAGAGACGDDWRATGRNGMVVAVCPLATEEGRQVLKRGGNAVDAAVATAFALAVTWPEAGNIGGGGFMLVHPGRDMQPIVVDYREMAPALSTETMFAGKEAPSQYKLVGVPGTVAGLALAHERLGSLPWHELIEPAIRLAADGFTVNQPLAASLNSGLRSSDEFPEFRRVYGKNGAGEKWQAGDRLVLPELAATFRLIAEHRSDGFYRGTTAQRIAAEMKAGGGLITEDDLTKYRAKIREPIHGTFRGYHIYGPPPPSSGGIALVEMLNILENFSLARDGRYSATTLHRMTEAMRRAYYDRARFLGDSDFVTIPAHLTSKDYAKVLADGIDPKRATKSRELASDIPLVAESEETTHFSVVDGKGMAVANTYTLEQSFGSRIVVRGCGFLLNNEMGDFNPRPGKTNEHGQIGTAANLVAPGKRMLSSMTPVIVTTPDGKPLLVTGSPGGRTIINTVTCVVLNVLEFKMTASDAVEAPRMHNAWFPDRLQAEPGLLKDHAAAIDELKQMGHTIRTPGVRQGDAHTIWIDPESGTIHGIADSRLGGSAKGN